MLLPPSNIDWHDVVPERSDASTGSMRQRLRWLLGLFALSIAAVLSRAVQLEFTSGQAYRDLASRPLESKLPVQAARGSILARDGTPLAADRPNQGLAVHYRYLEDPPDPQWLRRIVRARVPRSERDIPGRVAAVEEAVRSELADMHYQLAQLCQVPTRSWRDRLQRIQQRVETLAATVDDRRRIRHAEAQATYDAKADSGGWQLLTGLFSPPEMLPLRPVVLAEHLTYHVVVDNLLPEVAEAIAAEFPNHDGVRIVQYHERGYPQGRLAAHLVGYVNSRPRVDGQSAAAVAAEQPRGLAGLEARLDDRLRGRPGAQTRLVDHRGKLLTTSVDRQPQDGQSVTLTIDPRLQAVAEQLLDRSLRRLQRGKPAAAPADSGGAIVVMDVHSGELLALASAPGFDPNWFVAGDRRVASVLNDAAHPLFDRATRMALPPGSVFKAITAAAMVEHATVDPAQPFRCQGYFNDPDRLRCQLFRQHGIGHGEVTLSDALAQSCNVYFFHYVEQLGAEALLAMARGFGLSRPTGIESGEAAGQLPSAARLQSLEQLRFLSVGQGEITTTPLQIARAYAAIANGGHLIEPRLILDGKGPASIPSGSLATQAPRIAAVSEASLTQVRVGLDRVVADPLGTGYETVRLPTISISGKTGTAETGPDSPAHAWFAGYVPSEAPRFALVVVLEHGESGGGAAGPVAKGLVQTLQHLGYLRVEEVARSASR